MFSFLVNEGRAGQPKMMSVGLHCRLARPARVQAIQEFLDYARSYGKDVWICTREEIANHWYENHLPRGVGNPIQPSPFGGGGGGGTFNASGRFNFLGNLTVPRDQQQNFKTNLTERFSNKDEGDII